jgi:hypothetical protein
MFQCLAGRGRESPPVLSAPPTQVTKRSDMLLRQIWLHKGHASKLLLIPVFILMAAAAYISVLIGEQQQALQRVLRYLSSPHRQLATSWW